VNVYGKNGSGIIFLVGKLGFRQVLRSGRQKGFKESWRATPVPIKKDILARKIKEP